MLLSQLYLLRIRLWRSACQMECLVRQSLIVFAASPLFLSHLFHGRCLHRLLSVRVRSATCLRLPPATACFCSRSETCTGTFCLHGSDFQCNPLPKSVGDEKVPEAHCFGMPTGHWWMVWLLPLLQFLCDSLLQVACCKFTR